jgi:hypothetical protein
MVREAGGKLPGQQHDKDDQRQPRGRRVTHAQDQERPGQDGAKADTELIPGPAPCAWLSRWTDARPAAQPGMPGRPAGQREQVPARGQRPDRDRRPAEGIHEHGDRNSSQ